MTKTPIEPGDIRKGDLIRAECMIDGEPEAHEHVANYDGDIWGRVGGTNHFRLDSPKLPVVLPTEPGIYADKDGSAWDTQHGGFLVKEYAPFTKLEPVNETARHFVAAYRAYSSGTNRTVKQLDQAVEYVARKEFGATP